MTDQPLSDPHSQPAPVGQVGDRTVNTGGGPYVKRDLNTGGGDYIARDKYVFTGTPEDARRLRNRQVMVAQVYEFWIEGVLNDSLYQNVLIELNLEDKAEAVTNRPWDMVVRLPDKDDRVLPKGTRILDVYNQMNKRMLILGEPGAGKTTTLLQLVKELIDFRQDPMEPIPVVFNLSSWAEKQAPLEEWLIEELSRNYNVSKNLGRIWVESDDLSLFLDGLDEVRADVRLECVKAINTFRKNRASVAVCVCCRRQEYEMLPIQLSLNGAILLHPLTIPQVYEYLDGLGPDANWLRAALEEDTGLRETADSPLMVNIMLMAYQGRELSVLSSRDSIEHGRHLLFDAYVDAMFQRRVRTKHTRFSRQDTHLWLSWLARKMVDHTQTVFLIENLQPSWLQQPVHNQGASVGALILLWGLIYGLVGGLFYWLIASIVRLSGLTQITGVPELPLKNEAGAFVYALFLGVFASLVDGFAKGHKQIVRRQSPSFGKITVRDTIYGLYWALISGLPIGILTFLVYLPQYGFLLALQSGLWLGLIFGVQVGFIGGVIGVFRGMKWVPKSKIRWSIRLREVFSYAFWSICFCLVVGFSVNLIAGVIVGLVIWLVCVIGERPARKKRRMNKRLHATLLLLKKNLVFGLQNGLLMGMYLVMNLLLTMTYISWNQFEPMVLLAYMIGTDIDTFMVTVIVLGAFMSLVCGVMGGILSGIFFEPMQTMQVESLAVTRRPNEGIQTARNQALKLAVSFAAVIGVTFGLNTSLLVGPDLGFRTGIQVGLLSGLNNGIFALLIGGVIGGIDIFIKHYYLRLVLWLRGDIPRDYAEFLDYAADLIILRKVGGGYIFLHRMLMEYFAELYKINERKK